MVIKSVREDLRGFAVKPLGIGIAWHCLALELHVVNTVSNPAGVSADSTLERAYIRPEQRILRSGSNVEGVAEQSTDFFMRRCSF